jgi:hypothetical protein
VSVSVPLPNSTLRIFSNGRRKILVPDNRVSIGTHSNTNDGFNVVVYRRGGTWGARVGHRASGYTRNSKRPYPSQDAAKLAAFDAMLGMKHAEPWRR